MQCCSGDLVSAEEQVPSIYWLCHWPSLVPGHPAGACSVCHLPKAPGLFLEQLYAASPTLQGSNQPALVIPAQEQDFAFVTVEFLKAPIGSLLYLV